MADELKVTPETNAHKKHTLISSIMVTKVISLRDDAPFSQVEEIFRNNSIRHIPIVDKAGKLVGMVSQRDFLKVAKARHTAQGEVYDKEELDSFSLKHVMTANPIALSPNNTVANAIELMASRKFGAVPVVDEQRHLVGILSQIDILRFAHGILVSEPEKSYIDIMYARVREIDAIFRIATFNLENNQQNIFPVVFMARAHSSYLNASRLAMSGAYNDAYRAMKICIEDSLHAYYLFKNPRSAVTWLNHQDRKETVDQRKTEFDVRNLLEFLYTAEPQIGRSARELYTRMTDYIDRPADSMAVKGIGAGDTAETYEFTVDYLIGDNPQVRACMKADAETGLCSLLIFKSIFAKNFESLGLIKDLNRILEHLFSK